MLCVVLQVWSLSCSVWCSRFGAFLCSLLVQKRIYLKAWNYQEGLGANLKVPGLLC